MRSDYLPDEDAPRSAEDAFAEYLALRNAGDPPDFERWIGDHLEWAGELREMEAEERALAERLKVLRQTGAETPLAQRAGSGSLPDIQSGSTLGDYRLVKRIASGAQGEVWEALQLSIDKRIALKLLHAQKQTPRSLDFFAREAKAAARIRHPGIVAVFAAGELDGRHYIAEELVESGATLRSYLDEMRRRTELPPDYYIEITKLFLALAEAIRAAHEAGVLHRDLKPQNILLTPEGRPKVTDFGLARIQGEDSLLESGDVVGTYRYMSPEQVGATPKEVDAQSDVFSLGVMLYEALTLVRPFDGDSTHQIAYKIAMVDPPNPRVIRSRIPWDLSVICGKTLEKRKPDRYPSMSALAEDLQRHLDHEPIRARPPGVWLRSRKWSRRHPIAIVAIGIVSVALAIISVLMVENAKTAALAEERLSDVLSLSAGRDLYLLVEEAKKLWPASPPRIPAMEAWLARADALVNGDQGDGFPGVGRRPGLADHERILRLIQSRAGTTHSAPESSGEDLEFPHSQDRWWHDQLSTLIADLRRFSDPKTGLYSDGISGEYGWGIKRRLEEARSIEARSISGPEARPRWSGAIESIRDPSSCPAYGGLAITPQLGLLPIGKDPSSGLWEFAHLSTGEPATRDAEGRLEVTESTGLVLVLIPGGGFYMGAQKRDPTEPNFDPMAVSSEWPVHEVELDPFFLSKYEMSQAQWLRFTGWNHSSYGPKTNQPFWNSDGRRANLRHPVEQITWTECDEILRDLDLVLPTEAQWEYAARAGTMTPWSTGDKMTSLSGTANLLDMYAKKNDLEDQPMYEEWLDDGNTVHEEVGRYRPNAFGLHEMHGNVFEWCRDAFAEYTSPIHAGDGAREPQDSKRRMARGGSFLTPASVARVSARQGGLVDSKNFQLGVRPARAIVRP